MYFVIDQESSQEIEVFYDNKNRNDDSGENATNLPVANTSNDIDAVATKTKSNCESESEGESLHTPRESFDAMIPLFNNNKKSVGSEKNHSSDSMMDEQQQACSKYEKIINGEAKSNNHESNGELRSKEASKDGFYKGEGKEEVLRGEEEEDESISRRLVEYFVVVSSVPKIRKHSSPLSSSKKQLASKKNDGEQQQQQRPTATSAATNAPTAATATSTAANAQTTVQQETSCNDSPPAGGSGVGKPVNETTFSSSSSYPPFQKGSARLDLRSNIRKVSFGDDHDVGKTTPSAGGSIPAAAEGESNSSTTSSYPPLQQNSARLDIHKVNSLEDDTAGNNDPASGGSDVTATVDESRDVSPTMATTGNNGASSSFGDESASTTTREEKNNSPTIGDVIFDDDKTMATTSSLRSSTMKNNFFRSVSKQKKKLDNELDKSKKKIQNSTLPNLEKTLDNLNIDKKVITKIKSIKMLTPVETADGDDDDGDDHSSDSGSSDSDGDINNDKNSNNKKKTNKANGSKNKSRTVPLTPSTTPPPPPPCSPFHNANTPPSLPRISPLPTRRAATPRGASDNIRMGNNDPFAASNSYNSNNKNDDKSDNHSVILEPVITAQYPPIDHPNQPLNPMLPQFCHPRGIDDGIVPLTEYKMPKVHHFVLTDSKGGKLYGTCLTVYEEFTYPNEEEVEVGMEDNQHQIWIHSNENASRNKKYYAPRALCLLSTYPYLSAFRTYLTQLYRLASTTTIMTAPLERYIENICAEVPAPPPGSFEVKLSLLGTTIRFWAPPADQPIPYVSLPYGVLFECLDIENVLFAWYTLACERKILLVSSQLSLLTVCGEILCSMLFPMRWSHLYIPCLPKFLTPMLDAPLPYLCGICRDIFPLAVNDISDETVVVDLDRNVITMGSHTPELPFLPHRRKAKLEATLEKHAGDVFWKARGMDKLELEQARLSGDEDMVAKMLATADAVWDEKICLIDEAFNLAHGPDSANLLHSVEDDDAGLNASQKQSRWDAVQEGFLRFYVSMLKDYRKFMPSMPSDKQSSWRGPGSIDGGRFLGEEFLQSQHPDFLPFLEELIGTQQFDDFVTRRMYNAGDAPDIKFFDQSIDAKRNRSKLKLRKKETPFLHSAVAHRKLKQIDAVQPNQANLSSRTKQYTYPIWPESFDESLYGKPRPIPKIITAEFDRRSALAAMLRAKHGIAEGGRLPGSNNPSPEATAFVLFFVTFSCTIGKEWTSLEQQRKLLEENMLDQYPDGVSIADSSVSEGPWKPKVNPPWMEGGNYFQSLHSTFRPVDPPENIAHSNKEIVHNDGPSNDYCAPDCTNLCMGKAIDPSTFIGTPWARNNTLPIQSEGPMLYAKSPSEEEREHEFEKARAIAKAQIDLGYNTLKMMRMRKLPTEPITFKTLIEACSRCGIAHRAQQLMEMMTQDGMAVDSEVYFAFIKAISNSESETMPPDSRATDTSSELSTSMTNPSATSSSFSFLNSSTAEAEQSLKSSKFMDGFQNAMSSTIESNKRSFKMARSNRLKRLFKQKLTKRDNLCVTPAIETHLELGSCILMDLYPGINIDTNSDTCPKCSCVLRQDHIISGWKPCQVKDFSTMCPSCKHTFVPKFSVSCDLESFEGSQGKGTPLYCDYLSPWVLLQEIRSLLTSSVGGKAAKVLGVQSDDIKQHGVDGIINPEFREGSGINATLWWNMIVTFARFKIPFTFLLQGSYENQQLIMPTLEDT